MTMLVLALCCMMKILELSNGRKPALEEEKKGRRRHRNPRRRKGKVMNDAECGGICKENTNPDCNSNHPADRTTASCISNASSQDTDFIQDNSDYQWFLDYGYRDAGIHHHASILSSLSESYGGPEEVGYYDALSKNLDANLAEADMESFRTEDIHALLTTLPAMCTDMQLVTDANHQGEMFASVSNSMMAKFDLDSSMSPHSSSQGEESAASPNTMSICKSELLFSPVKETPMPGANFSVDSLDCDLLDEHDIMLTCQANKDNYTIAFEGSMALYSEESEYHESDKSETGVSEKHHWSCTKSRKLYNKIMDSSMARSDSGLTTWSKLKKRSGENQLRRHPSGNNNTSSDDTTMFNMNDNNSLKSQSLPNLHKQNFKKRTYANCCRQSPMSNSSIESPLLTQMKADQYVKVFDIQHQTSSGSMYSDMAISMDNGTSIESEKTAKTPHNFSLVKLFMKQKSLSAEAMSINQSTSECWPASQSDDSACSTESKPKKVEKKLERIALTENMFEDSLVDPKNQTNSYRTHDLIQEETEEISERSESVEQLSGSISRADSIYNSYDEKNSPYYLKISNNNNSLEDNTQKMKSEKPTILLSKYPLSKLNLMNKSMQTSLKRSSDHIRVIEPSFLSKLKQSTTSKPLYIVYPNYTLPDLDFLNEKHEDITKVYLMPQKYPDDTKPKQVSTKNRRPFSCNDVEALKRKGFSHVRDWDSLTFLLPVECKDVLSDVPEYMKVYKQKEDELIKAKEKPLFCVSPPMRPKVRPASCDYSLMNNVTNVSSSSSTATQPSSGYRGSSTILSDSSQNSPAPNCNNPLFVYRYDSVTSSEASLMMSDKRNSASNVAPPLPKRSISLPNEKNKKIEVVPPRPPLPKGILRKSLESKNRKHSKRYSTWFEPSENEEDNNILRRRSLQEPYYFSRRTFSEHSTETEDEGVEAGHATDSSVDDKFEMLKIRPPTPPLPKNQDYSATMSCNELEQLEEFLKMSGISTCDTEDMNESELLKLRTHVSRFLSLKINRDSSYDINCFGKKSVSFSEKVNVHIDDQKQYVTPPNSPNMSAVIHPYQSKTLVDMPICEEGELSPEGFQSPKHENLLYSVDLTQKKALITGVTHSVEQLIHHFSVANNQEELNTLGDAEINPNCAKLVLSSLCPALYALLSDGLKPTLNTPFGAISNSVWQVVEASAQQGPLTKALNELVMRINREDVITEGLLKFNAFVLGLLNVRSLDAWVCYLRTRETILRKHYTADSIWVLCQTGGVVVRNILDNLVATLQALALLPFQIDLLFEYRQLHLSLKRMDSYHQPSSPTHLRSSQSNLSHKQLTLMKLVHSIQSNMSQSCDDSEEISAATMIRRYSPSHYETIDPSLPDLLNSSAYIKTQIREDRQRPRSCIDPGFKLVDDAAGTLKKRWSGIHMGSKFTQAFERLVTEDTEEEYSDSLEHNGHVKRKTQVEQKGGHGAEESSSTGPSLNEDGPESIDSQQSEDRLGGKFRRLQLKWEMLSGKDIANIPSPPLSPSHTPNSKSKIPRLVNSPVKSGIPVLSPKSSNIPKKVITPPGTLKKPVSINKPTTNVKNVTNKKSGIATRTSRVDQLQNTENRIPPVRPSSLPYRPVSSAQGTKTGKITPPRRAASSSVNRKLQSNKTPKVVRTLAHRLPSDNGHLSFNEGEKLKVILEVDSKWLLCCRGDQKGLVPRSAVIALSDCSRN